MPAATVTGRLQNDVLGRLRQVAATSVAFAANGDTWTIPGMKRIYTIDLCPTTNASFGFTIAGNVITLASGGAVTFGGAVTGL
jgi:endonuclease YncB( thermonuclease family)